MKQWKWRVGAAAAISILVFTSGCGTFFVYPGSTGGSGGTTTGNYVYVANGTTGTLAGFAVGSSTLAAVSGSPYKLGFTPVSAAVNPANSILFVSGYDSTGTGLIYAFSIGSTGALSSLNNGVAVAPGYEEVSMDISPDGQWLLGLNRNNTTVDEFQINSSTGALSGPAVLAYAGSGTVNASQVKFSPNGQIVFVALGTAGDLEYTFNTNISSGALNLVQKLTFTTNTSDNALAISPNGSYLYIARSGVNGGLAVYSNAASGGTLTSVNGSPFPAGTQPYSVAVNSAGTDVYMANRSDGTISGYSIASTGALSALSGSPYKSGSAVTALALDKSGAYLLAAANGGSPDLTMYSFDSAGNLVSAASPSTGTDPTGPTAIATTR
jgi:6-phosphogluconolactonase